MNTKFIDLNAAADFLGPGAIEINRYQTEIFDIVRRRGVFGQRMQAGTCNRASFAILRRDCDQFSDGGAGVRRSAKYRGHCWCANPC